MGPFLILKALLKELRSWKREDSGQRDIKAVCWDRENSFRAGTGMWRQRICFYDTHCMKCCLIVDI